MDLIVFTMISWLLASWLSASLALFAALHARELYEEE
jgi:hypothetical protein